MNILSERAFSLLTWFNDNYKNRFMNSLCDKWQNEAALARTANTMLTRYDNLIARAEPLLDKLLEKAEKEMNSSE